MPTPTALGLFLSAALLLALTPGPGIFYVLARSLSGGRRDGIASACGTAIGGFVHVLAAAFGLSALLVTSAVAFGVVKFAGAAYLIFLGIRMLFSKEEEPTEVSAPKDAARRVFLQGITTEALNPKTALFFLAFLPQFINPHGHLVLQFVLLGSISVTLNTSADLLVALFAGPLGQRLKTNQTWLRRQRLFSGCAMIGLGTFVAFADNKR